MPARPRAVAADATMITRIVSAMARGAATTRTRLRTRRQKPRSAAHDTNVRAVDGTRIPLPNRVRGR